MVEFEYDIGDRVKVKTIETVGNVDALCQDINGKQYRIIYWNNGCDIVYGCTHGNLS